MAHQQAGKEARPVIGVHRCECHRPEQTQRYQRVEQHSPVLQPHMATQDTSLPEDIQREFEDHIKFGRLKCGLLRMRCTDCHQEWLLALGYKWCQDFC